MSTLLLATALLASRPLAGPQSRPRTAPLSATETAKARGFLRAWSEATAARDLERVKALLRRAGTKNLAVYLPSEIGKPQRFTLGEYAANFRQFAGMLQGGQLRSFTPKPALASDPSGTVRAKAAFVFTMDGERATRMKYEAELASRWVRQGKELRLSELRIVSEKRSF